MRVWISSDEMAMVGMDEECEERKKKKIISKWKEDEDRRTSPTRPLHSASVFIFSQGVSAARISKCSQG